MELSNEMMQALASSGRYLAVGFAAIGSSLGTGVAGAAAIGAMKKCYLQNKPVSFMILGLAGFPLSQAIYGFVMMMIMGNNPAMWLKYMIIGTIGGIAMGASSYLQGKAAAGACDALAETGKGLANYIIILGIIETVSIFALVFSILA